MLGTFTCGNTACACGVDGREKELVLFNNGAYT